MIFPSAFRGLLLAATVCAAIRPSTSEAATREEATKAMRRAAEYFRGKVATRGGYVYYYTPDLARRWGEGEASPAQIWVQVPGTPAVGLAYLRAFRATKDPFYLDAARETALALVQGQLDSGGWTHSIDFAATGKNAPRYRKMPGGSRNHSSLDDGVTQNALRLVMRVDEALAFKDEAIHEASEYARAALLKAQFPSGAFPQGWTGPVPPEPPAKASFPDYDWKTENRIKNYWDLPTLNDDLAVSMCATLEDAWRIYKDPGVKQAIVRLGDFLLLAQMPEPQPAWAQQYDFKMRPAWARKFEPPAIAGSETQGVVRTLLNIHRITGDAKYLEPIPKALAYLQRSLRPDGKLARYYELQTNRPLYMTSEYQLTYSEAEAPKHYGWSTSPKIESLTRQFEAQRAGKFREPDAVKQPEENTIDSIVKSLDAEGRWLSTHAGEGLVGQPKFKSGSTYLSSDVFAKNLERLAAFVAPAE